MRFDGMSVAEAGGFRAGAVDAYGSVPERQVSGGDAPCRCCLRMIPDGEAMLVLAYRPFSAVQPYAETGPVFLHAAPCAPDGAPEMLTSPDYLLKGYSADERIVYGTGKVTPREEAEAYAAEVLARADIAFVDLRSARNNCWLARITRG